ncbi:MAG: hypothetical protein WEE50_11160, partial [Chloroflexota bacterium]
ASPSLATVIRGLPNDHYHAFADPMVFVLVGLGAAALWRPDRDGSDPAPDPVPGSAPGRASGRASAVVAGRVLAAGGVLAILAWAAPHQPAAVHPDGGFPAAVTAADRIEAATGPGRIRLLAIPDFKSVESYAYPLARGGRGLQMGGETSEATLTRDSVAASEPESLVVICDSLFEPVIGAACGGSAEATIVPVALGDPIARFEAAPGRWISVYRGAIP